jgi:hypothetical protein
MQAPGLGGQAAGAAPGLVPPGVPHAFTRVTLPGLDNTMDYVATLATCPAVAGLPMLGWRDSSAVIAHTMAVPLLSIAGVVCLPAFLEEPGAAPTLVRASVLCDRR